MDNVQMYGIEFENETVAIPYQGQQRTIERWYKKNDRGEWKSCTSPHTWEVHSCALCRAEYRIEPVVERLLCPACYAAVQWHTARYPLDEVRYGARSLDGGTLSIIAPELLIIVCGYACTMRAENLGGMECTVGVRVRYNGKAIYA